jgi:MrfA Zn-binding domain
MGHRVDDGSGCWQGVHTPFVKEEKVQRDLHALGGEAFLHSLSHALMSEIALDCGYPASSLKERVYALFSPAGGQSRFGIRIYTATAGARGTLGGLVGTVPRFAHILRNALDRPTICSNDPVCADHEPDDRSGDQCRAAESRDER